MRASSIQKLQKTYLRIWKLSRERPGFQHTLLNFLLKIAEALFTKSIEEELHQLGFFKTSSAFAESVQNLISLFP